MPLFGVWKVAVINKDNEFCCSFCIVSGNVPASLGMPDCRRLQLLGIKGSTMDDKQKVRHK